MFIIIGNYNPRRHKTNGPIIQLLIKKQNQFNFQCLNLFQMFVMFHFVKFYQKVANFFAPPPTKLCLKFSLKGKKGIFFPAS